MTNAPLVHSADSSVAASCQRMICIRVSNVTENAQPTRDVQSTVSQNNSGFPVRAVFDIMYKNQLRQIHK
jgi:hypothetical protein